jgi:hypothetical protein
VNISKEYHPQNTQHRYNFSAGGGVTPENQKFQKEKNTTLSSDNLSDLLETNKNKDNEEKSSQ